MGIEIAICRAPLRVFAATALSGRCRNRGAFCLLNLFFLKSLNADFLREFEFFSSSDSLETQFVVGGSLVIRKSESAFMLCRLVSKVASSRGACCMLPLDSRTEGRL